MAWHRWQGADHPDPDGATLAKLATELGKQFPVYQAWGFADVGILFDYASLYTPTPGAALAPEQAASFEEALEKLPLLLAHRQTAVYTVTDQEVSPPRAQRAWPFFEDSLVGLFKEAVTPKKYAEIAAHL